MKDFIEANDIIELTLIDGTGKIFNGQDFIDAGYSRYGVILNPDKILQISSYIIPARNVLFAQVND